MSQPDYVNSWERGGSESITVSLTLAVRTPEGGSLPDHHSADCYAAIRAGVTFALVHRYRKLEVARQSVGAAEVA